MDRYREAAETLKLLPGDGPRGYGSAMPQPIRSASEAYNWDGARADLEQSAARAVAKPKAIDRLDEVLGWNCWLNRDEIRMVWGWAVGAPMVWIARKLHKKKSAVYELRKSALDKVLKRLKASGAENP